MPNKRLSEFVADSPEEAGDPDEGDRKRDRDPPRVKRKTPVNHPYKNHKIGHVVWVLNRDEGTNGYYTPRSIDPNLFKQYDSYPITTEVIAELQSREVEWIYVLERETATVYEYRMRDYATADRYDWKQFDEDGNHVRTDTQLCPARADAYRTWEDLGGDLFHSPI